MKRLVVDGSVGLVLVLQVGFDRYGIPEEYSTAVYSVLKVSYLWTVIGVSVHILGYECEHYCGRCRYGFRVLLPTVSTLFL